MEIKMIECPNGHYYNAALYASCPRCSAGQSANPQFPKTTPPDKATGAGMGGAPIPPTSPAQPAFVTDPRPAQPFEIHTQPAGGLSDEGQIEPVVGWLVCIEGPERGVDFRIHDGYNYIGREIGDIHIHGDNQISREKHAVISFYAKKQTFTIGPADGRNIIELNDEPVYSPMPVKSYDVITVGQSKLMLIAMCGDRFTWQEGVIHE